MSEERIEKRYAIMRSELTQQLASHFATREPDEFLRGRLIHHIVNCPDCTRKAREITRVA